MDVTERDSDRVKIHYVGYSEDYDEWRKEEELESLEGQSEGQSDDDSAGSPYQPFSIHSILRVKIKQALVDKKAHPLSRSACHLTLSSSMVA